MTVTTPEARKGNEWLSDWDPEDEASWNSSLAWRTLTITTFALTLAFCTWFLASAIAPTLTNLGFKLDKNQLYWLVAMPGLAGGTLRLVWMWLPPVMGTRKLVTMTTVLLLIPLIGWGIAVQNPSTSFTTFMILAFLSGIGGGAFSGFMPSTSYFFPRRKQGTALGLQAGIGNFGVSIVQFVTPWIIGVALLGGATFMGDSQTLVKNGVESQVHLQNAAAVFIPFVVVFGITAWLLLKSVPVKANFAEQFDIFKSRHTWSMTSLYMMTFGGFSGLAATFPLLIKQGFGGFEGAPDPLKYAFWGPLVGSLARVLAGPLSDKLGGARVTHWAGVGMVACAVMVAMHVSPDSLDSFPAFVGWMLALFFFAGIGNASTFKQMPMLFAPRQAAGVIGFTAAIAAYGPFLFGMLFAWSFGTFKSAVPIFYGLAVFFACNVALNWWMYARRGTANPC